jgi:hypothetical protein
MRLSKRLVLLTAACALGACHDDDGSDARGFDPFVTDLIQNQTSESSAPVAVEGQSFVFPTDADAFDDVLPPDDGPVVD